MDAQKNSVTIGLKLAVVLFPSFYLLDYFVYPAFRQPLLIIRLSTAAYLAILFVFRNQIFGRYYFPAIFISALGVSFSLSLMAFVIGDGFASTHYAGLLQVMLVVLLFAPLSTKKYAILMVAIISQHFVLLSTIPWQFADLLTNILALGLFALASTLIHSYYRRLPWKGATKNGFTTICSSCKRIVDKKGSWHQMDDYLHSRHGFQFSHGICKECKAALYAYIPKTENTPR